MAEILDLNGGVANDWQQRREPPPVPWTRVKATRHCVAHVSVVLQVAS